jgi:hypothetical protein
MRTTLIVLAFAVLGAAPAGAQSLEARPSWPAG